MTPQRADQPMFGSDDPLSILLEALVRTIWLAGVGVWMLGRLVFTQPWLVIMVGSPVAAWLGLGPRYAVGAVASVIVTVVAWRVLGRSSFNRLCAPRLATTWRTPWYRLKWPRVARRHRLVAFDHSGGHDSELPRLRRVKVERSGTERLLLRLPSGLTPDDVAKASDGIAHAFRCLDARVVPKKPGWIWLDLHRHDSLAAIVPTISPPSECQLERVPVGRREDGTTWSLRLSGTHVLIAGATGSGKGSILWSLLNAMAPDIEAGRVAMWVVDPKGGMELRPGLPLFARFEDGAPDSMCDLLEELVQLKDERARELAAAGLRVHAPTAGSPHIVLVIDELATLTAFAERTVIRRIDQALGLLLTQGRACGITVVAAVQDPGKHVVGWRDLFPTRVALRLDNPIQVDMVLGDGAREAGARADQISELTPGVAFVRVEGTRELRRVRAAYLNDDDVAALAASIRPRVGDPA